MTHQLKAPSVDEYWGKLEPHLRPFSAQEQRVAVALYRELAKGKAVDADQLARALDISPAETLVLLQRDAIKGFVYADEQGRVLGFGGLSAAPMHHRFEVQGRTLWTWCAWDSLFIPGILGRAARVTSSDPESKETVWLDVNPDQIESVFPDGAVASFTQPDALDTNAVNVMAKFCHFIFFFSSRESGERWVAKHPGTFLYSLEEAFELAGRLNARNFGQELSRQPQRR